MAVVMAQRGRGQMPAAWDHSFRPSSRHTYMQSGFRCRGGTTPMLNAFSRLVQNLVLIIAVASMIPAATPVFVNFENCLVPTNLINSQKPYIHFTPLHVWANFDALAPKHGLTVVVYGNVSGQTSDEALPPLDDDNWSNPNKVLGKIVDYEPGGNLTTLLWRFNVLSYSAWDSPSLSFCEVYRKTTVGGRKTCPVGPSFDGNASDPSTLPAIGVSHDFNSAYSFATWSAEMKILSGTNRNQALSCMRANITPYLGDSLANAVRYVPAAIAALVAMATIFAATKCPWGTSNLYRWTSNYGRDEDILRLVTPGFGDCLQYIQFAVLIGSLSLNYPGFFQPVLSQASWSVLLFNQSFVSRGDGYQSLVDGVYFVNGTYGLTRLGQYVGMSADRDIWACMAVFLLVLIGAVIIIVQIGSLVRLIRRSINQTQGGDLTKKNWSFTIGNIVRVVFNFFMLPIISLSLFQLVLALYSPGSVVAAAVVLLVTVVGGAIWIFWLIFTTRPRAHLFDDLPTVLTYGPLYNTYSDDAAPFAFIPVLLTIIRGVAIGAIQPSGIAQIVVLAMCEVILILTLHAFRPFQSNTSMNAYHTFFSTVRLTCILLSVAFVPSLEVGETPKGWIGYVILLLHAVVLVFGFFLNALQTIIEVAARLAGAGGDQRGGLTTVFGKRQLSKRNNHRKTRNSLNSNAAMLAHDENKHIHLMDSRSRSMSASSGVLLNGPYDRESAGFDQFSGDHHVGSISPSTPGTVSTPFNHIATSSAQSSRRPTMGTNLEANDPYYRPPRPRKATVESIRPSAPRRPSEGFDMVDVPYTDDVNLEAANVGEGPSRASGTLAPAYFRINREDSDPNLERRNKTDYSVRESDFYYGLRGPALSSQAPRRLKTGPADPLSPVSSATGWFKSLNLLGGLKKEKNKGFEVVRSTRIPPQMMAVGEDAGESPEVSQEPYRDSPDTPPRQKDALGVASAGTLVGRRDSDSESDASDEVFGQMTKISATAPRLAPIEIAGDIEPPSRIGSRASRVSQDRAPPSRAPNIPRRNSRRAGPMDATALTGRLSAITNLSTPATSHFPPPSNAQSQPNTLPIRLPFGAADPSPSPERSPGHSAASSLYPNDGICDFNAPSASRAHNQSLNTGFVQHHMTKDSLQSDGVDAGSHLEASAEFIGRSRSGSTHESGRSRGTK